MRCVGWMEEKEGRKEGSSLERAAVWRNRDGEMTRGTSDEDARLALLAAVEKVTNQFHAMRVPSTFLNTPKMTLRQSQRHRTPSSTCRAPPHRPRPKPSRARPHPSGEFPRCRYDTNNTGPGQDKRRWGEGVGGRQDIGEKLTNPRSDCTIWRRRAWTL